MSDITDEQVDLDTTKITHWRSILMLVVFVIAIPLVLYEAGIRGLVRLRVLPAEQHFGRRILDPSSTNQVGRDSSPLKPYVWFHFPVNFVTGPLIADLFLLAIGAIGRREVKGGIAGSDNIVPYDILLFFFSLAYIAISIDASGLIRYLAFKVLQLGGKVGHRLFFFLYAFFFGLGSFIGNDPIILSGTAFLAYMTRVSSNIVHPRAWIHTQFSVANIASAILVSSNPTNLVLAGAFQIKFIDYTRDMVVPVVITAILLFPFLLYIVFANESLIPSSIKMHELDEEARARKPVNPNIPYGRGTAGEEERELANNEAGQQLSLEEIMNPFLDKAGAAFGGVIMAATLITILVLNEVQSSQNKETRVFYVTLPAATVMLVFDLGWGWIHREETRKIARDGRQQVAEAADRKKKQLAAEAGILENADSAAISPERMPQIQDTDSRDSRDEKGEQLGDNIDHPISDDTESSSSPTVPPEQRTGRRQSLSRLDGSEKQILSQHQSIAPPLLPRQKETLEVTIPSSQKRTDTESTEGIEEGKRKAAEGMAVNEKLVTATPACNNSSNLVSVSADAYRWLQDTFPTVIAVFSHLPFALLPFAFEMFILVQGLVTNGWVPVFAYGWDHWVTKTGTIGAIGGMGFLSVILCNFAGTNIGTTILLSRVIQAWEEIHRRNMQPLGDRTKWATIYSMALGVNYGAFSIAFSASLAGLLWRDILARKHIRVRGLEFARVNLPIISIAMTIGLAVLTGEIRCSALSGSRHRAVARPSDVSGMKAIPT
ncbi:hypothetical protein FHL15_010079 [Xylaria flabelliformis]|uniref:Citrate transporter-like domain-containing protein n=1 Tax=Xylaria flabelliformis TaxID=2512241 RepID=A0A553HM75_9PEZI|nr:hypothetical protein FHL15_010079 [Xylaria flabelliformis]